MPVIYLETKVRATIEACFDAARDIDLHRASTPGTDERAVAGVTKGRIGLGETVTWEARHLGVRQRLTSKITLFDRPRHFRDSQVAGAFARFDHDHYFVVLEDGSTLMSEAFDYASPWGALGRLADWLFLQRYMRGFLARRADILRRHLEGEGDF